MKHRIYLDMCCFNRPYDEQSLLKVKLETQAKLSIQKLVLEGKIELVWSFILSYENAMNPFTEKKIQIAKWCNLAMFDCDSTDKISETSEKLMKLGLRLKDSLHIACAIFSNADYFITTDKGILNRNLSEIKIINPVDFIFLTEESHES